MPKRITKDMFKKKPTPLTDKANELFGYQVAVTTFLDHEGETVQKLMDAFGNPNLLNFIQELLYRGMYELSAIDRQMQDQGGIPENSPDNPAPAEDPEEREANDKAAREAGL